MIGVTVGLNEVVSDKLASESQAIVWPTPPSGTISRLIPLALQRIVSGVVDILKGSPTSIETESV